MIVLAVLLLLAVALVTVFVLVAGVDSRAPLEWDALNLAWDASPLVLFLLGAVTLLAAMVALALLRTGTRRNVNKSREMKRLRAVEKEQAAASEAERRRQPEADTADDDRARAGTTSEPVREPARAVPEHTPETVADRDTQARDTQARDTQARDPDAGDTWHDAPPERR